MSEYWYLGKVNSPAELKKLNAEETDALISEIRNELVLRVSENGGHLASNLGVVELTVALHRVFSAPADRIIWDVGHQSYVHKMLTGRYDRFSTIRLPGGISGFTRRSESEYDPFGAGHSSTSISAALGFAQADKLCGRDNYTVAVVGDGAFTGGMIHEALNNCSRNLRLIIVLNENEMSISKNIGGFAHYIAKIRAGKKYYSAKRRTRDFLSKIPLIGRPLVSAISSAKRFFKNQLYGSNFFEEMGVYYLGPVDGNDVVRTARLLEEAKNSKKCCVVHVKTKKGYGYPPAQNDPDAYHGIRPAGSVKCETFSERFGDVVCEAARADGKICAITAAMSSGTGLNRFRAEYPDRFFDVGIAEDHAVTFAAGLAAAGMKPVCAVYSTFLQRAFDSVIHDVALQHLPVKFFIDRAGLSGSDGPTHHGIYDVSFLTSVAGIELYAPLDMTGFDECAAAAFASDKPAFVRYPGGGVGTSATRFIKTGSFARALYKEKLPNVIVTYGKIADEAVAACDVICASGVGCNVVTLEKLLPEDGAVASVLGMLAGGSGRIVFLEEGMRAGGMGEVLYEAIRNDPLMKQKDYSILAIDNGFADRSADCSIYETFGISSSDILQAFGI